MDRKMSVSFSPPDITEEEILAVNEVLRSGWITTGPKTKLLEQRIAEYCHTEKAVCLNSATACMELVLRMFDIKSGDEVIIPAYTYTATASVVYHVGAKIVMIDTAKDSYHLDYDRLEQVITNRTKAIIPVDIAGVMVDYGRILEIVETKRAVFEPDSDMQKALGRILVLADAAHSFGAHRKQKMSGEYADFTSFSFHAVKNMTTGGEGGGLVWNGINGISNEDIYKNFMLLSLHGQSKDAFAKAQMGSWEYDIKAPYYKCNMTDIMAGIGLVQLKRYDSLLAKRKEVILKYTKGLEKENVKVLQHFSEQQGTSAILCNSADNGTGDSFASNGHLYMVRLTGKDSDYRNKLIIRLAEHGVSANVHYKPLPMHTAYKNMGFNINDFPNSYEMFENGLTLPLHTSLTQEQIQYVIDVFNEIQK